MNKIYNNLTVDNLIKTEWINQFDELQQKQIRIGLFFDLNVSKYANPRFNEYQMLEIRLGLKNKLDVSQYAKKEFDYIQMEEIRIGLLHKVDVSIYAKPEIDWWQMRKIRTSLEKKKINVFIYAKLTYFLNKIKLKLFKKSTLK